MSNLSDKIRRDVRAEHKRDLERIAEQTHLLDDNARLLFLHLLEDGIGDTLDLERLGLARVHLLRAWGCLQRITLDADYAEPEPIASRKAPA